MKQKVILLLTAVFIFFGLNANQFSDSLEHRLSAADDTSRVKMLCDLCWEYRYVSADSAILFGKRALKLAGNINYPKGEAQSYNDLGIVYIGNGEFQLALEYFDNALEIRKKLGDTAGIASLYNKMGIVHQKQGNLKLALENQIDALRIYEQLHQDLWIGYSLNNIAIVHQNLGNLEKSLEYHFEALEYRKKMNDLYGEGGSYGNIANVYVKLGDTATAIGYYEKSLSLLRQVEDAEAVSVQLSNMGNIYAARGENETALKLLNESLQIREKLGERKGISSTLIKLGDVFINLREYDKAEHSLRKGLAIAKQIDVVEEEMGAYITLAKMFALSNHLDSAFKYTNKYIATKDSVYERRLEQQIVDVQEKYETEKRQKEIELLRKEKELTEIGMKQRKTEIGMLIFLIISLVGAGIFVFYRRKQLQQAAMDTAAIRHGETQLKAVLEGQEQERRRIARELHDGVGQTLSGIKLNWELISGTFKTTQKASQLEKMSHMLDDAVIEVRSISHQMMPKELEQFGLVPTIRSILLFSFGNTGVQYEFEETGMENRLPQTVELGLFRIFQELIANILKHAGASKVSVQLVRRSSQVMLMVEDNGKGFEYNQHTGSGIGLMNIESRVKAIHGKLNYETVKGKGTIATIRIPLT
ncbi:MAG: sensor histidine kinase [Bacteroidales bacterium]|nr:sensor histidine kinase [Bacteroidales bacterium]MCF6341518.1 sensor histidine kinase [Bacteroidales bacterium]